MNISKNAIVAMFCVIGVSNISSASSDETIVVQGYVTHGINVLNNKPLTDYSQVTNLPVLNPAVPILEIGVLNTDPGATDSKPITEYTDPSAPVATIRSFVDFVGLGDIADPTIFNKTLDQIGSNFFGSDVPTNRVLIDEYEGAGAGSLYAMKGVITKPTVGQWAAAKGKIRYTCHDDGSATVELGIKNAFPKSLYTMWDVGVLNPLTENENFYLSPLGGVPNVMVTDAKGCANAKVEVPYCPGRPCEAGASSCSSYLSVLYHWDDQVYGGSPLAGFMGLGAGAIGSNHLVWPMSGTPLMESQNGIKGSLSCNRRRK